MTVLIDASVLIDHLRGDERARDSLRRAARDGERLVASVLTEAEVMAGMRPGETDPTMRLLGSWIEVDDGFAERAGWLTNRFLVSRVKKARQIGPPIGWPWEARRGAAAGPPRR